MSAGGGVAAHPREEGEERRLVGVGLGRREAAAGEQERERRRHHAERRSGHAAATAARRRLRPAGLRSASSPDPPEPPVYLGACFLLAAGVLPWERSASEVWQLPEGAAAVAVSYTHLTLPTIA